ncbi:MAG: hypothetical protein BGO76_04945 [Caedibacter sp. 38-128]|nr:hypothetical protein [Holosporales bacterium]OJX07223.1 MAG: hypothetical protein BGO76_04945 [Caedibacter sp. 38-128]
MKYILTTKVMTSLLVTTSIFLSFKGEAVTTFGQEEDTFSRIWSHPSENSKSKQLDLTKQGKNYLKKEEKDLTLEQKNGLSGKRTKELLNLLHHKKFVGSSLH